MRGFIVSVASAELVAAAAAVSADVLALGLAVPAWSFVAPNLQGSGAIRGLSFDHAIRPQQQRLRDRKAERLGGVPVNKSVLLAWTKLPAALIG